MCRAHSEGGLPVHDRPGAGDRLDGAEKSQEKSGRFNWKKAGCRGQAPRVLERACPRRTVDQTSADVSTYGPKKYVVEYQHDGMGRVAREIVRANTAEDAIVHFEAGYQYLRREQERS